MNATSSLRAVISECFTQDFFRETYSLQGHETKIEVVGPDNDPVIRLRVDNVHAQCNLWRVANASLQIHLLERWIEELVSAVRKGLAT